jgi:dihydroorotase
MTDHPPALLLQGGRVLDPSTRLDGEADVLFQDGAVAAIGPNLAPPAGATTRSVKGCIVTPGLIDLHTHVFWGGTSLGVEPDALARRSSAATLVDAGSAGPGTFLGFRKFIIEPSPVRILAYLHISWAGIFGFQKLGESEDARLFDPAECVRVARANQDLVVGIKVRLGRSASGDQGIWPLDVAIDVAQEVGMPVMAHIDHPPPMLADVLARLRPGDVLTHCYRGYPNAPVAPNGRARADVIAARERGVVFDVGHGAGSFGFGTARAMISDGFLPDVISSDVHAASIDGPAFDLLVTMSKFLCLGVPLADVVRAATEAPAAAINRPELGTLKVGAPADAAVLRLVEGTFPYSDTAGEIIQGGQALQPAGMVARGEWFDPPG